MSTGNVYVQQWPFTANMMMMLMCVKLPTRTGPDWTHIPRGSLYPVVGRISIEMMMMIVACYMGS